MHYDFYPKYDWQLTTEKINENEYVVIASEACKECEAIYTKFFFKWQGTCWNLVMMENFIF